MATLRGVSEHTENRSRRGTPRDGTFIAAAALAAAGLLLFLAGYRNLGPLLWLVAVVVGLVWLARRGAFSSRR